MKEIKIAMLGMVEVFVKTDFELFWKLYYIFLLAFMFIYFFKDVINGQSIGKRIMKIKVVDLNGNKASLFNLIIRNITSIANTKHIIMWSIKNASILFPISFLLYFSTKFDNLFIKTL